MATKTCTKCKIEKLVKSFYVRGFSTRYNRPIYTSQCRDCKFNARIGQSKLRRNIRKAANLCAECGVNPPQEGKYCCDICLAKAKLAGQRKRKRRKDKKLCLKCGRKPKRGKNFCAKCIKILDDDRKSRHASRRAAGNCIRCDRPNNGSQHCDDCGIKSRTRLLRLSSEETEKASAAAKGFDGPCDCCGSAEPGHEKGWCIDHDHKSMKFRGMICHGCNIMLGCAKDTVQRLESGKKYLLSRGYSE